MDDKLKPLRPIYARAARALPRLAQKAGAKIAAFETFHYHDRQMSSEEMRKRALIVKAIWGHAILTPDGQYKIFILSTGLELLTAGDASMRKPFWSEMPIEDGKPFCERDAKDILRDLEKKFRQDGYIKIPDQPFTVRFRHPSLFPQEVSSSPSGTFSELEAQLPYNVP